ncbi:diacylglycerol/lipid kinase family protein [Pajaroellobacter abortibovis]|uniref:DAGKc domain-containing protein n=1 Tax=Pajaroellobacter abortibovis TaxID=1882918 RepID=A0A1L6MXI5_9BACT|nr:diacylglycerol kinase family protein [Pajaroellobacter abortibovis]APS00293.1 hypothetical protein BCY86_06055 [Pajaroellobacter abortibovis]
MSHVCVVINPEAGHRAGIKKVESIRRILSEWGVSCDIQLTERKEHAKELVTLALQEKVDILALAGGDGTLNEAIQAYVDAQGEFQQGPPLALIPIGTGNDFCKTIGIPKDLRTALVRLKYPLFRWIDVGLLTYANFDQTTSHRAFLNMASFGIGGHVDRMVKQSSKWLGGRLSFFAATLHALMDDENASVRVKVDGRQWLHGPVLNVAIANGRFFGGGMMIAPQADPADGCFDVVALKDISRWKALVLTPRVYRGTHLHRRASIPEVEWIRGSEVEVEVEGSSVLMDVDGELIGRLPLRAKVIKRAIQICI